MQSVDRARIQALHLRRIEIRTNTGNHSSRTIPERLGFTQEGIVRQGFKVYNRYNDSVIYGLLADERLGAESAN